ncbi:MAG: hypothetical protein PHD95_00280 [Candidatus ainarchaeum sp.]|nr:hypothetical protein [Candidatus ainarchaeum sp.]
MPKTPRIGLVRRALGSVQAYRARRRRINKLGKCLKKVKSALRLQVNNAREAIILKREAASPPKSGDRVLTVIDKWAESDLKLGIPKIRKLKRRRDLINAKLASLQTKPK